MWEQGSPPASGIIYCETEGPHGHVDNKTAALPFFHSLSHVCPDEDPSTRLRLCMPFFIWTCKIPVGILRII